MRSDPRLWPFGVLLGVCIVAALLISRSHLVVNLTNDRTGRAILGAAQLHPGQSTEGLVNLGNSGIAPFDYTLSVTGPGGISPPPEAILHITADATTTIYSGPLPAESATLGRLNPGQRVRLHIVVSVPAGSAASGSTIPLDVLFNWGTRPALVWYAWWLWVVAGVVIGVAAWVWVTLRPRRPRLGPSQSQD